MPNTQFPPAGERLDLDSYLADFDARFWAIDDTDFWKLERQQSFREPGTASWEAFARGDWDLSLRLIAEQRAHYIEYFSKIADHGFGLHRVRVVELPVSAYLQWELHLLHLKAECGEDTRVIGPEQVKSLETDGPLPELIVLGTSTMYEILYDSNGTLAGAVRFTDMATIVARRNLIQGLFDSGEPLDSFFRREIAPLGPPIVD